MNLVKTLFASVALTLSFSALSNIYKGTLSEINGHYATVVSVKTGDSIVLKLDNTCFWGDDCVDGFEQIDVRLTYIAAPKPRQKLSHESYMNLKERALGKRVIYIPIQKTENIIVARVFACQYVNVLQVMADQCDVMQIEGSDSVEVSHLGMKIYRDGKEVFEKIAIPKIKKKTEGLTKAERLVAEEFADILSRPKFAKSLISELSSVQVMAGFAHVDPKYADFEREDYYYKYEELARLFKKGIWALPEEDIVFPWDYK
jgi:endonuclease YncB( thermonuclease family)